jgi:hypothetical protein
MKTIHNNTCIINCPTCICNTCAKDTISCCIRPGHFKNCYKTNGKINCKDFISEVTE